MPTTIAVILILIALSIVAIAWRGISMRRLVTDGVATQATILRKIRFRGKSGVSIYRLRYSFVAADSKTYEYVISMSKSEAADLDVGSTLDITYLPKRPSVSAASSMVALAAQALNKRK